VLNTSENENSPIITTDGSNINYLKTKKIGASAPYTYSFEKQTAKLTLDSFGDLFLGARIITGISVGLSILCFLLILALIYVIVQNNKKNGAVKIGPGLGTKERF